MHTQLAGQWIGQSSGDPNFTIVVDLDTIEGQAVGWAYLFPDDEKIPASYARIQTADNLVSFTLSSQAFHFDANTGYEFTSKELENRYPEITFQREVTANFKNVGSENLLLELTTGTETYETVTLIRKAPNSPSMLTSEVSVTDWKSFFQIATSELNDGFVFRGQPASWPLQTSFHRTNRKDLFRYLTEDVPQLHRALTARTRHVFELEKPDQNGAFLNLAQHHGYPTPLLDWTYSPFVAAYFAYSKAVDMDADDPVRIFAFDQKSYRREFTQLQHMNRVRPHFSILEALSIENDRAFPQQGVLTLTNIQNIEAFVKFQERKGTDRYLFAYDLPRGEAQKALSDLRLMGITQATLFPGIESTCMELKSRRFD